MSARADRLTIAEVYRRQHELPNTAPLRGIFDVHPLRQAQGGLVELCAFSDSLRDLKLVPSKRCCLVPPTSTSQGHNANRWAYRFEHGTAWTPTVPSYLGGAIDPRRAECQKLKPWWSHPLASKFFPWK